jgi:hypothetical protein
MGPQRSGEYSRAIATAAKADASVSAALAQLQNRVQFAVSRHIDAVNEALRG